MSRARKYAAAMHEVECGCGRGHCIDDGLRMAEACLPVADAEVRAATDIYLASIHEWKARAEAAESEREALRDELDRERLSQDYKPEGVDIVMGKYQDARRERDALRAQVEAVRALADGADRDSHMAGDSFGAIVSTDELRAALSSSEEAQALPTSQTSGAGCSEPVTACPEDALLPPPSAEQLAWAQSAIAARARGDFAAERAHLDRLALAERGIEPAGEVTPPAEQRHCGKGLCAAMEGHEGTCAEASGWAEEVAE